MRVLFLCRRFYPDVGGVETHVLAVGRQLLSEGHTVTVITERTTPKFEPRQNVFGISVIRIKVGKDNWFKKFRIWKELFKYKKIIGAADIVHCHDVYFWYFPFRYVFPKKRVYITFHGYEGVYPPSEKAILVRNVSARLVKGTINIGDYIQKWYGTKADYVSYGGTEPISKSYRKPKNNDDRSSHIVFIGRFEKDIGVDLYLRTLKQLEEKKYTFTFTSVGGGSLRQKIEKWGAVSEGVSQSAIDECILSADIVFASSYLTILRALRFGKFVIAVYDNPLKKDYLLLSPFAKWIVISDSPARIVQAILSAAENPAPLRKKLSSAVLWAGEQTWDTVAKMYTSLWQI